MKLLLIIGFAVLGMVAAMVIFAAVLLAGLLHTGTGFLAVTGSGHAIHVEIYKGADRIVDQRLAALDGATAAYSGGWGISSPGYNAHFHTDEAFKVAEDGRGHFTIAMHRVVEENGSKVITDSVLPVWDHEPAAAKRIRFPDGSAAVAYLTLP